MFEKCRVDFIIVHPRTVRQKYEGEAGHRVTAATVQKTVLPVIANGDIFTDADGRRVLEQTGAAGLMLGRGAVSDPLLFKRIRGEFPGESTFSMRQEELNDYLQALQERYRALFCGEQQVLAKMKEVVVQIRDPEFREPVKQLLRAKGMEKFEQRLQRMCS